MTKHLKKLMFVLTVTGFCVLAVSCGKENKSNTGGVSDDDEEIVVAENETEDWEKESEEEVDDGAAITEIAKEDADVILKEKTDPLKLTPVYNEEVVYNNETYYTYTVLDENEEEIDQLLAVNGISGEVSVYDLENAEVRPYSEFKYYNAETDEVVDWSGKFQKGDTSLILEPADEVSFEFTFEGGSTDKLMGVATLASNRKAVYEDDNVALVFMMKNDVLTVADGDGKKSGYAGEFKKK